MSKKRRAHANPTYWEWRESRKARRQDELRLGDRVAATLRWQGMFSTLATGRTPESEWTFDRPRLLSRDVEVRDAATNALVAIYHERWQGDGTLEFADGRTIDWAPTNFWQTDWAFFDAQDRPVISFDDTFRWFEPRARVTRHRSDLSSVDDALLTILGRYLTVLKQNDTAAIAASTAAIASA